MNKLSFYGIVSTLLMVAIFFTSCDQDFTEMGSGIVDDDHFAFKPDTTATVIAYTQSTGVVQSNNLPINSLGIYKNPVFGKVKANFATQLELETVNPVFLVSNNPVLDSVVLTIPYFSTKKTETTGAVSYTLDSVKGVEPINLKVYESGFVLNNLDPTDNFQSQQNYYTDQDGDFDSRKNGIILNNAADVKQNTAFVPSNKEVVSLKLDRGLKPIIPKEIETRLAPRMRLMLDKAYFQEKILNAPSGKLVNNNIFKEYFRGIYFQIEDAADGTFMQLDFSKGFITLHYREYASVVNGVPAKYDDSKDDIYVGTPRLVAKTVVLKMTGNTVNLLETDNSIPYSNAITNPNKVEGDAKLFIKGGVGSVAVIDLFGPDNFGSDGISGAPDGVSDELNIIRNKGWLINEANLTFYVDRGQMGSVVEPERVFLYDLTNKRPLIDWGTDLTGTASRPKFIKLVHDGILQKNEEKRGVKYRVRITNHIRNLIRKDSTNVRLGLSVTEAIGIVSNVETKNTTAINKIPTASLLNPLGTILYGSNISPQSPDYDKRLKLEIYYTKPN